MLVNVDMVESKPGFLIGAKLSFDLSPELCPHRWPRADIKPESREVLAQMPARVNEIRHPFGRQRRLAVDQHQMQTDAQAR